MRRIQLILPRGAAGAVAGLGLAGIVGRFLQAQRDATNVRTLAARFDCSPEEARRLYELSRQVGFGAAHETVFGLTPQPAIAEQIPPISEADLD